MDGKPHVFCKIQKPLFIGLGIHRSHGFDLPGLRADFSQCPEERVPDAGFRSPPLASHAHEKIPGPEIDMRRAERQIPFGNHRSGPAARIFPVWLRFQSQCPEPAEDGLCAGEFCVH